MKALIYKAAGKKSFEDRPKPEIDAPKKARVRMIKTTIGGSDLHISKGDLPTCKPGHILGHEGVGIIGAVGSAVTDDKVGDHVLISCISACGKCVYCRKEMYSQGVLGSWILGNTIDSTQAEFKRTPLNDMGLYHIPKGYDEAALVMLSDIFPTGFECGVLNAEVAPGCTAAIVGAGPVGLAALLAAQFYSPAQIIMADLGDSRSLDTAIKTAGIPATFELCPQLVTAGGNIANVGVRTKKVDLHLEAPLDRKVAMTKQRVDTATIPMPSKIAASSKIDPTQPITHHFKRDQIVGAYDTFCEAAKAKALTVFNSA